MHAFNMCSISFYCSWDEMAKYDLPAIVNFILSRTGQPSLYYAGHSQGTLIPFAELSRNKALARKIKAVFAMGPVAYLNHMESPLKYVADLTPEVEVRKTNKMIKFSRLRKVLFVSFFFFSLIIII